jgi:hypothetical protein
MAPLSAEAKVNDAVPPLDAELVDGEAVAGGMNAVCRPEIWELICDTLVTTSA